MNNVKVGDIFRCSWGYDQTNVDFYQVISRTAKMVTVRMIQKEHVGNPYSLESNVMPKKDCFLDRDHPYDKTYGKPMRRKLCAAYDGDVFFSPASYSIAKLWDGKPKTETYTG